MTAARPLPLAVASGHRLAPMLDARSIAVAGVSQRPGSFGLRLAQAVTSAGFNGRIDFVNPRYDRVLDKPCHPSLAGLGEAPDLAILGVGAANLERSLLDAIEGGAKSAVIFDACFGETTGRMPLLARLKEIATEHEIPVCGGAGMGLINVGTGCVASFYGASHLKPGGITLIAHSGSVFTSLAMNDPRYRFDLLLSPGQEIGATIDEYIDFAAARETTKVIAVFMEFARNPKAFRSSLERARRADVPVVVRKVGRTDESARMARSHTGALAGSNAAYDAVFVDTGAIIARSVDELMNIAALCATGRRPGQGGTALITDSGGLRELAIDLAAETDARLARLSETTIDSLRAILPAKLEPSNPLDCAADMTEDFSKPFQDAFRVLSSAHEVSMIGFEADLRDDYIYEERLLDLALGLSERTDKPCFFYSSFGRANNFRLGERLADRGVPCINGIGEALNAVTELQSWADARARLRKPLPAPQASEAAHWNETLAGSGSIDEHTCLALLSSFGIPVVDNEACETLDSALSAADRLGYPLALKTAARGIEHKSEVGGVLLDLRNRLELANAYQALTATLGPRVIVQRMAPKGVELAFGCVRDPDFGPLVMVSAGGILVEHFRGQQFALPPFGESRALELLDRLPIAKLLDGVRGGAPADKRAASKALSAFSIMCASLGDRLLEVDVNPLIVSPSGAMAVDALVIVTSQ